MRGASRDKFVLTESKYDAFTNLYSLSELPKRIEGRKKCLTYFSNGIKDLPEIEVPYIADWADMGAWYGYKPLVNLDLIKGHSRDLYIKKLNEYGVEVNAPSGHVLNTLPLYNLENDKMFKKGKSVPNKGKEFPIAEMHASTSLSLPTFTNWDKSKPIIDQYVEAFRQVSKELIKSNSLA